MIQHGTKEELVRGRKRSKMHIPRQRDRERETDRVRHGEREGEAARGMEGERGREMGGEEVMEKEREMGRMMGRGVEKREIGKKWLGES